MYDINNFIGQEKKEIHNLNLYFFFFFATDVSDSPGIKLPSLTRVFYLTSEILFNLGRVPDFCKSLLTFSVSNSLRKPLAAWQSNTQMQMVQKVMTISPRAGQGVQESVQAARGRLELDSPFPSYLRLAHCPSERTVAPRGMRCRLDSSSLLFLLVDNRVNWE